MRMRGSTDTARAIGWLIISIAANLVVFAYIFSEGGPVFAIYGIVSGIAGAYLLRRYHGRPSSSGHAQSEADYQTSYGRESFPSQVTGGQACQCSAEDAQQGDRHTVR